MNCTIVKGRFTDEIVCTPINIMGVAFGFPSVLVLIIVLLTSVVIRVDKIVVSLVRRILRVLSRSRAPSFQALDVQGIP